MDGESQLNQVIKGVGEGLRFPVPAVDLWESKPDPLTVQTGRHTD